jgi:acetyltransferase-like isoleucine patch superfamily enzyme
VPITSIGRHSYVTADALIATKVSIGNFSNIAPAVHMLPRIQHPCMANPLLVSSCSGRAIPGSPRPYAEEGISIGHDVWVGQNAVLMGHITVGHGAIVGAFAVVAKDIPPYAIVVGNPARILRYRFDPETVEALLTVRWWDWPDEVLRERQGAMQDVRVLVQRYAYESFPNSPVPS